MWRQFFNLTFVEFKIFLREPVAVFFNLFFPMIFLLLTMHVFLSKSMVEMGYINYFIPSFMVIITTGVSVFNIPIYIVKYRNLKFLKRLRVAPISPVTILLSMGLANLFMLIIGIVVLITVGILFYGAEFTGNVILFAFAAFLTFLSLGSLGLLIASFCRGMRTVSIVGQLAYYPLLFFSGVIPIDIDWVVAVQKVLPISYGVQLTQRLWNNAFFESIENYQYLSSSGWIDAAILSGSLVICLYLALKTFKWE